MINFKNNFKTISLTDDQFLLIKQIANLGFVTKPQLEMIYSIIKNKPTSISNHILNKLVNKDKVLNRIKSNESQNRIKQIAYVISRYGRNLLSAYHCFYRDPRSFGINFHNLQANEVVIQALYASNFKPTALRLGLMMKKRPYLLLIASVLRLHCLPSMSHFMIKRFLSQLYQGLTKITSLRMLI